MFKYFISFIVFLNSASCAFSQAELKFIDLTSFTAKLPNFSLKDENHGNEYSSADHKGAVYVIEAYFNECPYCNQNASNEDRLSKEFPNSEKIQIVQLSVDCDEHEYQTWLSKYHPSVPVLNDCDGKVVGALGISAFPTVIVFNPAGNQAMRGTGVWSDSTYSTIEKYLQQVH